MNSVLRPNYRRARELKAAMDDLRIDYERASDMGNFSEAQDIKDALHDMEHAYFLTGVTSEYDL